MHLDVLLYCNQSAQLLVAIVLVHLERLNDDDAAFHFSFDHVDFSLVSALERF